MRSVKSTAEPNNNNIITNNNNSNNIGNNGNSTSSPTSPICRCRVTYLGSSVPHITKDGLQGIQEPLRELYPDKAALGSGNAGIDSWLSVWSNGILIENVDETGREVKRFFKIDALHYCAAVKFVPMPLNQQQLHNPYTTLPNGNLTAIPKFLPLDSPHARQANNNNPPIFASILRRTSGIKVLECHAFICKREAAANALVRCCFHAYADTMYAKQIGADINGSTSTSNGNNINNNHINGNNERQNLDSQMVNHEGGDPYSEFGQPPIVSRRSKSIAALNDTADSRSEVWKPSNVSANNNQGDNNTYARIDNVQMVRRKSINEHCDNNPAEQQQLINSQKFSKSMHHLNQPINGWVPPPQQQPFYNPYASRVPSYPPQNIIDATSNGGTIKSIRSLAANSIASTLLRSKKHAKAMSMAQLNHQDKITSFHQPHSNATTMIGPPIMMPPVPPMFLPNMPHAIINGSQTMKIPSRPMIPVGPHMNFEAMTPKEMKKLLKKSAKYGIDTSKFGDNGLPLLPLRPPPQMPQSCHIAQHSKSGTIISQSKSVYSEIYSSDMPDLASMHGLPIHPRGPMGPEQCMGLEPQMKPILVQPNPEFLKSKAGKKWLKQQKEFKKLLPPHLDGLPIVFGPPPMEALEPATVPNNNIQPMAFLPPHPGIPMMDSSGFYNPNPFYAQNGRASAASTLLRYSPHSQLMHDQSNGMNGLNHNQNHSNYLQQGNNTVYHNGHTNNMLSPASMMQRMHGDYSGDDSSMIFGNHDAHNNRQFVDLGNRYQKRNHMVEQSVISLGDENDFDDDGEEEEDEVDIETDENSTGVQHNDYYIASNVGSESSSAQSRRPKQHQHQKQSSQSGGAKMDSRNRDHEHGYDHQAAAAAMQVADDQGSYSSGIYRRGHINERAFSYSIRQEHKSSGNSDAEQECHMNHHDNQQRQHPGNMFQGKRDQNDKYYHHDNNSQSIPVNELTARLENQLNMKSFSNSRIKSHM